MTIAKPIWFEYCVWDYSDPSFPVLVGLRDDTPKEIKKQFERDQRMYRGGGNEVWMGRRGCMQAGILPSFLKTRKIKKFLFLSVMRT